MRQKSNAPSSRVAQSELLLTFDEAAEILGLTPKTLRNQRTAGRLGFPVVKIGRLVRITRGDVLEYIVRCREVTA